MREETGAWLWIECMLDETLIFCIPQMETVEMARAGRIGEQAAIDAAYEALRKQLGTQTVTKEELIANGTVQYYPVTLTAQTEPVVIAHYAELDAHTARFWISIGHNPQLIQSEAKDLMHQASDSGSHCMRSFASLWVILFPASGGHLLFRDAALPAL